MTRIASCQEKETLHGYESLVSELAAQRGWTNERRR